MKVLALADEPSKYLWDYDTHAALKGIGLILACGDLPPDYLEYLTNFTDAPIFYVHGNHDSNRHKPEPGGCVCLDDTLYYWHGLRILGFGGCMRYNASASYQFTEKEMAAQVHRMRGVLRRAGGFDILMTHSPARGLNDQPDLAHRGFECYNTLLETYQPGWFIHGHVHLQYSHNLPRECTAGATTVINASERYIFEIPDEKLIDTRERRLDGFRLFAE